MLSVFHTRQDVARRRAIARQFIRHDHPRPIGLGRRSERGIDRWAKAVLLRPPRHPDAPEFHQQVMIRRRHIDVAWGDRFAIHPTRRWQRPRPTENLGYRTRAHRWEVQDDTDRRWQLTGEIPYEDGQSLHPSRRRANDDEVMAWHQLF
jgi:hypothetical protein